ncbi:RNA-binding protein 45-like [Mya arenaria]|uniref:RNA-binding protein 45-like n=1 Tax=Mya arenaria TaxID=6604 RepID=UPI0022E5C18A|nr:RNA-binding protein 45-like [Mya arenaria]
MSFRDYPENTRLFILTGKGVTEDTLREKFEQYGKIEDLWIVKDKRTHEDKGVVYITFSKCSEAALAMEEMNGKILEGNPRPLKVIMASTKRDGSVRDNREEEKTTRLFVIIPKSFQEDDLTKAFTEFGDVHSVNVLRDRDSGSPKGFGFVRFHRPYHAALALENCDKSFKPKFAEPKKVQETPDRYDRDSYSRRDDRSDRSDRSDRYNDRYDDRYERRGPPGGYPYDRDDRDRGLKRSRDDYHDRDQRDRGRGREDFIGMDGRSRYSASSSQLDQDHRGGSVSGGSMDLLPDFPHANCQRLHVTTTMGLTQPYLHKLFNIVPGLEYCDLNEQTGVAYVRYETPQQAAYAREKLDQFEYPIGSRLSVRFADNMGRQSSMDNYMASPGSYRGGGGRMDLMGDNSVQQVHQAARVLEQAGINPDLVLQPNVLGQGSVGGHALSANNITSPRDDINERVTYCNAKLPLVKSLLPEDTPTDQRLFIVCQPAAVPERILRDAFSRFGNLIEVYLLNGRNFGYAKYANKDSAMAAIRTLHGQTVAGQRLKVLEAEPMKKDEDEAHKRQRTEVPM